jgi:hypothetical protein
MKGFSHNLLHRVALTALKHPIKFINTTMNNDHLTGHPSMDKVLMNFFQSGVIYEYPL